MRVSLTCSRTHRRRCLGPRGFTLLEIVVVLLLMALATALVAPAIASRQPRSESELSALLHLARQAAVRRGEVVRLTLATSGQWTLVGEASAQDGPITSGRLAAKPASALTITVSPLGACAPALDSASSALLAAVDPLTCQVVAQ